MAIAKLFSMAAGTEQGITVLGCDKGKYKLDIREKFSDPEGGQALEKINQAVKFLTFKVFKTYPYSSELLDAIPKNNLKIFADHLVIWISLI